MKNARVVVLLHGLGGSSLELRFFARRIRQREFRVVIPNLTGYGRGATDLSCAISKPDFRRWIAELAAEVDALAKTHAEVYLCGIGLGATLALAVAAERPTKVDALSLISTTLFFDGWNVSRWRFLLPFTYYTPMAQFYRTRPKSPYGVKNERMRAWIAARVERGSISSKESFSVAASSLLQAARLIRHVIANLGRIRTATLMVHAREDDVASLANVNFVRRQIGTDMFREVIVNDSYSMIMLDNDCDHAALKTMLFFNSLARRRVAAEMALCVENAVQTQPTICGGE